MKKYRVTLTEQEKEELKVMIASGKCKYTKQKRAQILLETDESEGGKKLNDEQIATAYDVKVRTVERLRKRFVEQGYDFAIHGVTRSYNHRQFDSRVSSKLLALRCSEAPSGYTRTLRLLADKMVELVYVASISHESVRQLLKKHQLNHGK